MSTWAPDGFSKTVNTPNLLVEFLSPKARQATLAAISKFGTLQQGTWNGCVFNAAGQLEGANIRNIHRAAETFEMSPRNVRRFIQMWDEFRTSSGSPTGLLKEALEHSLTSFAGTEISVVVHESEEQAIKREFDDLVSGLDIPYEEQSSRQKDFSDSVVHAAEMLFA